MIDSNLLWARAIDPMTGRIVKQHTFLGAALTVIAGAILAFAIFYVAIVLFAVL